MPGKPCYVKVKNDLKPGTLSPAKPALNIHISHFITNEKMYLLQVSGELLVLHCCLFKDIIKSAQIRFNLY